MVWLSIAGIIIFVIALVLAFSLVPVKINMDSARSNGKITGNLKIRWAMLLLGYAFEDKQAEILLFNLRIARFKSGDKEQVQAKEAEKTGKNPHKTRKKQKKQYVRGYFNLIEPVLRLIKGMFGAFKVNIIDFDVTYGMNDPGITGILTGFLHAVTGLFRVQPDMRFNPDFTGWRMDWNIRGMITFIPFKLVLPVLIFITNMQVLRVARRVIL